MDVDVLVALVEVDAVGRQGGHAEVLGDGDAGGKVHVGRPIDVGGSPIFQQQAGTLVRRRVAFCLLAQGGVHRVRAQHVHHVDHVDTAHTAGLVKGIGESVVTDPCCAALCRIHAKAYGVVVKGTVVEVEKHVVGRAVLEQHANGTVLDVYVV